MQKIGARRAPLGGRVLFMLTMTLLGAATLGSVVAYQRAERARALGERQTRGLLEAPPVERTPATLMPGDVVLDGGDDWLVSASVTFSEENERSWRHHLEDGARRAFLDVQKRDGFVVAMLTAVDDVPLFGQLKDGLTYRGAAFTLERRGTVQQRALGLEGELPPLVQYARYTARGEGVLIVEEDRAGRRALYGRRVPVETLELMPGESPDTSSRAAALDGRLDDDDDV